MPKGIPGRDPCSFPGCDKPSSSRGLCNGHDQQRRAGKELKPLRPRWPRGLPCSVCGQPAKSRGLCQAHYKKWLKYGDPTIRVFVKGGASGVCSFPDCERPAMAKTLCWVHRRQQLAGEELHAVKRRGIPLKDRLLAMRVIDANGCWLWTGFASADGYGRTSFGIGGRTRLVHRMAYELWVGPPGGSTVHHKCGVRGCFNPDHLELATLRENSLEMHERRSLKRRIAELEARVRELEDECHCRRPVSSPRR